MRPLHAGANGTIQNVPENATVKAIGWEEARALVREVTGKLPKLEGVESVPLTKAHGRVLAATVNADRDYPALRRSLRDGFAVHSKDLPGTLQIRGERRAGDEDDGNLERRQALEIMTGAPVPESADAIVMVEHVTRRDNSVLIKKNAEPGQFINPRGAEAKAGQALIKEGVRLDASHVATLAMTGHVNVEVRRKPRVAILATGDEIVPVDRAPDSHQIRNSNSFMLASLVAASGGIPTMLPVSPDRSDALTAFLSIGLEHDMLLVSGGVSAGKYDLVKPCLRTLGVEFVFERVRIQPGQPTAFGTRGGKVVFGLPGNPGSTLVTYQVLARMALEILEGESEPRLPFLRASFVAPFHHKPGLTRFLPAFLEADGQTLRHVPWKGSSDVPALAKANVFLVADEERESWEVGDSIRVIPKP